MVERLLHGIVYVTHSFTADGLSVIGSNGLVLEFLYCRFSYTWPFRCKATELDET